jgi:hypothetical protein
MARYSFTTEFDYPHLLTKCAREKSRDVCSASWKSIVELRGFEPLTSSVQGRRSPS